MSKTLKTLLAIFVIGVGSKVGLENIGPVKRDCEIYQGYHINAPDGEIIYVFDPQNLNNRRGSPKHLLVGNPALMNSMIEGERYCIESRDPIAPWAPKELVGTPQPANEARER
jgi:hypothetical protein